MKARVTWLAAGLLAAAAANAAAANPLDQKTLLVTVVAPATAPQRSLAASDFTLTEDKHAVEVTGAQLSTDPLSIVLVVDVAQPPGVLPPTADLRRALGEFVTTILGAQPDAQIAMLQVANAATSLVDFTSNLPELQKATSLIASQSQTGSVMLEGVVEAAKRLATRPAPRRAVVCVSFGSAEGGNLQPKKVAEEIQKSGVTLWAVSVEGSNDTLASTRENVWNVVTVASGGLRQTSVESAGLTPQLKIVANSLLSQYVLTFTRQGDGALKTLKGQTRGGAEVLPSRWVR